MRGLIRALREIAVRARVGPYLGDLGATGHVYTRRIPLDTPALQAGTAGVLIARGGGAVHCHPQTHAGFRGEIYFGEDAPASDELWQPLTRCQVSVPPNGESFRAFRVRLVAGSNTDATAELVLVVDPAPYGSEALEAQPPTPEIGAGGSAAVRIRAIRHSDNVEADVEGADGASGTRVALAVAAWTGAAYARLAASAAGRLLVNLIVGQDGVAAGAGAASAATVRTVTASDSPEVAHLATVAGWDAAGRAQVDPIVGQAGLDGGVGDAGAATVRVVPATTPTSTSGQAVAGAASAEIVPANAARKSLVLTVPASADTGAYVRAGAPADATAYLVMPGTSITLTDRRAVHALRGGSADVTIYTWEEAHA